MKKVRFTRAVGYLLAFSVATVIAASAQNFAAENFDFADGGNPRGPLVQGLNGDLYGTTVDGGANFNCASQAGGCGTIFQLAANGKLSAFYSFCAQANCTDGDVPAVGLILGADGNFYGTTSGGGAHGSAHPQSGTVFRITPGGKLTTLYSFCSQVNIYSVCLDGAVPYGLLQATDGNLYGITDSGGNGDPNNQACYNPDGAEYGCGTIFKITTSGQLTTLYTFCLSLNQDGFCPDGAAPSETLVQGSDGNFYSTTPVGGANACLGFGCGTVFKITPAGTFSTLYSFCPDQLSCIDGKTPGMLMRAADGNIYGVATQGGPLGGGSVFQISLKGALTTLYGFCNSSFGACPDGSAPISLIQGNDGNFYGTTGSGGATCSDNGLYGCGTIFRLTPHAVITTLHSFCQNLCYDGIGASGLVQATNGALLGLSGEGGADHGCFGGCGTVYGLTAGLKPLVEANPNFGKPGQSILILGSNLTSAASVTFNGTPAKFSVVSGTELRAMVPTGATTGTIQVTTSKTTLSSNLPFQVQ